MNFLLHPQVARVVQAQQGGLVRFFLADGIDDQTPPGGQGSQRANHRRPDRCGIDDRGQRGWADVFDAARPSGAEGQREGALFGLTREHIHGRVGMGVSGQFQYQMRRGAEPHQPQAFSIAHMGQAQGPIADGSGAEQWGRLGLGKGGG